MQFLHMTSINPATGDAVQTFPVLTPDDTKAKIESAHAAHLHWQRTGYAHRAQLLMAAADYLRQHQARFARLMTDEMGKTLREARTEVEKCAWVCSFYAEHGAGFLADETIGTDASKSYVHYAPLGTVLAVMPWNFPFWQVFRFAAPALMAGNAGLLKHASNVPGCAAAIEEVFLESGFPQGLFLNLHIPSDRVEQVIRHPHVKAVTLTGSDKAGRSVARIAGDCLKKTVLELGGSDPYLVLPDADLELATETCKNSRLINAGQSCISAKRMIVVAEVYDDFLRLFMEKMAAVTFGDPTAETTGIGPMARADLRDELHLQVVQSIEKGASCILGGQIPDLPGAYYPPTILTDVKPGMPAYDEELFGPVAAVIRAENEADAIRIANDSAFGLGAAVFTQNIARGEYIAAHKLAAGSCFVNGLVKSDPRLPFGGIRDSGYGRELSLHGIREFVNVKTVWVK